MWSIHLEDGKYVVRLGGSEGKKEGKSHISRRDAADRILELEKAYRKKAAEELS